MENNIQDSISIKNSSAKKDTDFFSYLDNAMGLEEQINFINYSHNFCVCIVDIIGSTDYTFDILNPHKVKEYYSIFLNTMSTIIKRHNGKVIKNVGDCLLYYFPKTINQDDEIAFQDVIECGLAMTEAKEKLNNALNTNGLSSIEYRISGNYGKVELAMSINSQNVDMFGSPVNICSKINSLASANEMIIHDDLFQVIKKMFWYPYYVFKEINNHQFKDNNIIVSTTNNDNNHGNCDINDLSDCNDSDITNKSIRQIKNKNTYNNWNDVTIVNSTDNINRRNSNINHKRYLLLAYSVHRMKDKEKQKQMLVRKQKRILEIKNDKQHQKNSSFHILLIDDDEDILSTFSHILKEEGYIVDTLSNSLTALKHFIKSDPYYYDLVVMDIRMPELNGIKLYSQIKAISPDVSILFLSSLDAIDEMLSIFPDIKHDEILRKPIEPVILISKISMILRGNTNH